MDDIDYFKATYGLRDQDVILVPYGSRVYGTHSEKSDYDYTAIVPENRRADTGTEFTRNQTDIQIYNRRHFQDHLKEHKIHAIEAYFHPSGVLKNQFVFKLCLPQLRKELSAKSNHSFVKAKKKIEVEKDYYIGWKSLFHSLRILIFAKQLAVSGKITNFEAANLYWTEIVEAQQYNWDYFKDKYQPVYNELATDFRKHAPKE